MRTKFVLLVWAAIAATILLLGGCGETGGGSGTSDPVVLTAPTTPPPAVAVSGPANNLTSPNIKLLGYLGKFQPYIDFINGTLTYAALTPTSSAGLITSWNMTVSVNMTASGVELSPTGTPVALTLTGETTGASSSSWNIAYNTNFGPVVYAVASSNSAAMLPMNWALKSPTTNAVLATTQFSKGANNSKTVLITFTYPVMGQPTAIALTLTNNTDNTGSVYAPGFYQATWDATGSMNVMLDILQ